MSDLQPDPGPDLRPDLRPDLGPGAGPAAGPGAGPAAVSVPAGYRVEAGHEFTGYLREETHLSSANRGCKHANAT